MARPTVHTYQIFKISLQSSKCSYARKIPVLRVRHYDFPPRTVWCTSYDVTIRNNFFKRYVLICFQLWLHLTPSFENPCNSPENVFSTVKYLCLKTSSLKQMFSEFCLLWYQILKIHQKSNFHLNVTKHSEHPIKLCRLIKVL